MASATLRRSHGKWYIRVTGERGAPERWSTAFERKQEAERELARVRANLSREAEPFPPPSAGTLGFDQLADRWWTAYAEVHVTPNTRRSYAYDLRALKEWFGGQAIGTIDLVAIDELVSALTRAGASPQTTRHRINRLRQILRWAAERRLLAEAPPPVKTPRIKRQAEPLPLTPPELEALLAEAPAPWGALFATIALHGLRPGEARGLRWRDLSHGWLHVREVIDSEGLLHEPKAGSVRSVPLDPEAARLLAELPTGQPEALVFAFLGSNLKPATRELRAALRRAGVPGADARILYDLRHTHASIAITLGVQPVTLARRMGNSVPVAMSTYVRYWEDFAPDADVLISAGFSPDRRGQVGGNWDAIIPTTGRYLQIASGRRDSNPRPSAWKAGGLRRGTSLSKRYLARLDRSRNVSRNVSGLERAHRLVELGVVEQVRVHRGGDVRVGVPQLPGDDDQRDAAGEHHAGGRVPEPVEAHQRPPCAVEEPRPSEHPLEGLARGAVVHRPAAAPGPHVAAGVGAAPEHRRFVPGREGADEGGGERHPPRAPALRGLDDASRRGLVGPGCALLPDRPSDRDPPGREVEVGPAQADDLAAAQPCLARHAKHRLDAGVGGRGGEEPRELLRGEDPLGRCAGVGVELREAQSGRRAGGDPVPLDGGPQDGPKRLHRARDGRP
jgi:integrase